MTAEEYTLHLSWVHFTVPIGGTNTFLLPADTVRVDPKPVSQGQVGSTTVTDINHVSHYRCDGWRHDVTVEYDAVPEAHHTTLRNLVQSIHANGGEATFAAAYKDGSVDTTRQVDVVAAFGEDVLPVVFEDRVRQRPASLRFRGKSLQSQPFNWLTD